ncbi:hypothetical protein FKP32DRAFT_1467417 [Trametes sanguinea]|nr:hypothetical protein FKP32DRAFT_1467417 [Trametes sanguinea]
MSLTASPTLETGGPVPTAKGDGMAAKGAGAAQRRVPIGGSEIGRGTCLGGAARASSARAERRCVVSRSSPLIRLHPLPCLFPAPRSPGPPSSPPHLPAHVARCETNLNRPAFSGTARAHSAALPLARRPRPTEMRTRVCICICISSANAPLLCYQRRSCRMTRRQQSSWSCPPGSSPWHSRHVSHLARACQCCSPRPCQWGPLLAASVCRPAG